jgi:hypothetical protein
VENRILLLTPENAGASGSFGLDEEAPEQQNAQNHQDCDDDDLDQTQS